MFKKKSTPAVTVPKAPEPVRSVEIPAVTTLKRRMEAGDPRQGMIEAFAALLLDLQRGFNLEVPDTWTDREILAKWATLRPAMATAPIPAELQELVRRFYSIYEPSRFGPPGAPMKANPVAVLQSIYSFQPLWRLHAGRTSTYSVDGAVASSAPAARPSGGNGG